MTLDEQHGNSNAVKISLNDQELLDVTQLMTLHCMITVRTGKKYAALEKVACRLLYFNSSQMSTPNVCHAGLSQTL